MTNEGRGERWWVNMMDFNGEKIIPVIRNMKNFESAMKSDSHYVILLDSHVSQLRGISDYIKKTRKKLIIHVDLIQGLKNDEYATQFLIQEIKPIGLISTRAEVIITAKKKGLLTIQRLFLLDSNALEKNYRYIEKTKPDYIEVIPGVIPHMITEVFEKTGIPILAGGLIRTEIEIKKALKAGAVAITTSNSDLWKK